MADRGYDGNGSGDAGENCTEMAGCARKNEQMPDKMAVPDSFIGEEKQARSVSDATCEQPNHRFEWHSHNNRPDDDQDDPAHTEVKNQRQLLQPDTGSEFYDNTNDGEEPDQPKHRPAY